MRPGSTLGWERMTIQTHTFRLLLVEDDVELCGMMTDYFRQAGHRLDFVNTGPGGLVSALTGDYDLVLLDVMLPYINGFSVLQQLRRRNDLPVILLTARAGRDDRIQGLEKGADDYVTKPFDPDELLARIRAVLRRSLATERPLCLDFGALQFDAGKHEVRIDEKLIALTSLEYDILEMLVRSAGHIVSRDDMSERLLERQVSPFDRALDVHVSRLRAKLGGLRKAIRTVRGSGYIFSMDKER